MSPPAARIGRRLPALLLVSAMTMAGMSAAVAAPALPAAKPLAPPLAWTDGNALGRTTGFLQTAWASDCPPPSGRCATDRGPFMGVFWQRAHLASPSTWTPAHRLSQPHLQAARPALAASGDHVYAAWVTQTSYLHYKPKSPRRVWIRSSGSQGSTWGKAKALSPPGSRADFPVIAASGNDAWVVWTAAASGQIRMATTTDGGGHWAVRTIGTTTSGHGAAEGFHGYPAIGASGTNVLAAWFAGPAGKQVALASTTGGAEWTGAAVPQTLTPASPNDGVHYPVVRGADDGMSTDVAVAYTTATGVDTRLFDGGTLGSAQTVAGPWGPSTYAGGYGAAAMPFGTGDLAVVWSGCRHVKGARSACRPSLASSRIDLLERETTGSGVTWSPRVRLAAASKATPVNEDPSLVVDGGGLRSFLWLKRTARWSTYRVWVDTHS